MSHKRAFTLVELMVVIAIITLLLALLLPGFRRARETARRAVCLNNTRQLAMSSSTWTIDNGGYLMAGGMESGGNAGSLWPVRANGWNEDWLTFLKHHVGWANAGTAAGRTEAENGTMPGVFKCPSTSGRNYWPRGRYGYYNGGAINFRLRLTRMLNAAQIHAGFTPDQVAHFGDVVPDNEANGVNHTDGDQRKHAGGNVAHYDGSARWYGWQDTNPPVNPLVYQYVDHGGTQYRMPRTAFQLGIGPNADDGRVAFLTTTGGSVRIGSTSKTATTVYPELQALLP